MINTPSEGALPFLHQGQHTIIHNAVFDVLLPRLSPHTCVVLMLLLRRAAPQSFDVLMRRSGLDGGAFADALPELYNEGLAVFDEGDNWSLNPDFALEWTEGAAEDITSETEEAMWS